MARVSRVRTTVGARSVSAQMLACGLALAGLLSACDKPTQPDPANGCAQTSREGDKACSLGTQSGDGRALPTVREPE